jgi:Holliday junction resolvasome RuvABC ATP-dependent DNA helicase subunit
VKIFFGSRGSDWETEPPSDDERRWAVSSSNPLSPFSKFIGNEKAVRKLQAVAFDALGREDHLCRELAFAIFGPSSSGKTTLARLFAASVQLPFIEISPKSIRLLDDLLREVDRVLAVEGVPLIEMDRSGHFVLPPCIIFIDEVHALNDNIVQGLLKATEYTDAILVTESRKKACCFNVCWIIATTDEGRLFEAFRTRFSPINLKYLAKSDVARIVKLAHPELSDEVCNLVAYYNSRIPRKALEFTRYMKLVKNMDGRSWEEVARQVAEDEGIDQWGMHETHLRILRSLGQGPVSQKRIVNVAGRKQEEVERFIMPWLLTETEDAPALVTVTSRGYTITEEGISELNRRGIEHRGQKALAKVW